MTTESQDYTPADQTFEELMEQMTKRPEDDGPLTPDQMFVAITLLYTAAPISFAAATYLTARSAFKRVRRLMFWGKE